MTGSDVKPYGRSCGVQQKTTTHILFNSVGQRTHEEESSEVGNTGKLVQLWSKVNGYSRRMQKESIRGQGQLLQTSNNYNNVSVQKSLLLVLCINKLQVSHNYEITYFSQLTSHHTSKYSCHDDDFYLRLLKFHICFMISHITNFITCLVALDNYRYCLLFSCRQRVTYKLSQPSVTLYCTLYSIMNLNCTLILYRIVS